MDVDISCDTTQYIVFVKAKKGIFEVGVQVFGVEKTKINERISGGILGVSQMVYV